MTATLPAMEVDYRVTYGDTDKMGVVYYSNYLVLFERGRTEFMRHLGIRYKDLEERDKIYLPASEASLKFVSPARYDDLLKIRTWIQKIGSASIIFEYKIYNAESGKEIMGGTTRHPFVDGNWKPIRIPDWIKKKLGVKA